MKRHISTAAHFTHADLEEIRTLIEQRSAVHLDESRERFFSTRVHEYAEEEKLHSGTDVLRKIRGAGAEYDAFLERLLTQETSFFRYPAVYQALAKTIL